MQFGFADRALEARYRRGAKGWQSEAVVRRFFTVMAAIDAAQSRSDLEQLRSLRCHALVGDRAGQHSLWLTGNWRLCVCFHDDEEGEWVEICEIVDYH